MPRRELTDTELQAWNERRDEGIIAVWNDLRGRSHRPGLPEECAEESAGKVFESIYVRNLPFPSVPQYNAYVAKALRGARIDCLEGLHVPDEPEAEPERLSGARPLMTDAEVRRGLREIIAVIETKIGNDNHRRILQADLVALWRELDEDVLDPGKQQLRAAARILLDRRGESFDTSRTRAVNALINELPEASPGKTLAFQIWRETWG